MKDDPLAKELALIHSKFSIYSQKDIKNKAIEFNIIELVKSYNNPKLLYLTDYYKVYEENYYPAQPFDNDYSNIKEARRADLPFIGMEMLSQKKAKFMFIFEGSLANNKLSMTVFSHLWILAKDEERNLNSKENSNGGWYWPSYYKVKEKLGITKQIADNSYVTDAIRIGNQKGERVRKNNKKNHELLIEEINLLRPELIICIGAKARKIIGMDLKNTNVKCIHVPFPKYLVRESTDKKKYDQNEAEYNKLREAIIKTFENK